MQQDRDRRDESSATVQRGSIINGIRVEWDHVPITTDQQSQETRMERQGLHVNDNDTTVDRTTQRDSNEHNTTGRAGSQNSENDNQAGTKLINTEHQTRGTKRRTTMTAHNDGTQQGSSPKRAHTCMRLPQWGTVTFIPNAGGGSLRTGTGATSTGSLQRSTMRATD